MKRIKCILLILALLGCSLLAGGCGKPLPFTEMAAKYGINLDGCTVNIYFRSQTVNGTDPVTHLENERAVTFIRSLSYSTPLKEPDDAYSIHSSADYQIVLNNAGTDVMNLYYDESRDWIVAEVAEARGSQRVMRYSFYQPDPVFLALLDIAEQDKNTVLADDQLQTSALVLRAGITTEMLSQEASSTPVNYELYTGNYAYDGDRAVYRIYTSNDLPDVLSGSDGLIVASLGPCPTTGYAINISQVDYTDQLIRVYLYTESPLYPANEEQVETYPYVMATCDIDDFPLGLTVAFIDQNYNILDVQELQVP